MPLAIVLLAAGQSRRMRGRDKLLERIDGKPLLRHLAERACKADIGHVGVTLPPGHPDRDRAIEGLPVTRLIVPDAQEGLAASLRAAARWGRETGASGLMLLPADMPELTVADFVRLAASFDPLGPPLRATSEDGVPGHPVLFPARLLTNFDTLSGDIGARDLLRTNSPRFVVLPAAHATVDLDTPEEWEAWRSTHTPESGANQ